MLSSVIPSSSRISRVIMRLKRQKWNLFFLPAFLFSFFPSLLPAFFFFLYHDRSLESIFLPFLFSTKKLKSLSDTERWSVSPEGGGDEVVICVREMCGCLLQKPSPSGGFTKQGVVFFFSSHKKCTGGFSELVSNWRKSSKTQAWRQCYERNRESCQLQCQHLS